MSCKFGLTLPYDMAKKTRTKSGKSSWRSTFAFVLLIGLALGGVYLYQVYRKVFKPNVEIGETDKYLYIHTGSTYEDVVKALAMEKFVKDTVSFNWLAGKMNYPQRVHPGKYQLTPGMSNRELISMLRAGTQSPVRFIFHNIRTKEDFAGTVGRQLECDSITLLRMLNKESVAENYGFSPETFMAMFIPNTYEFYWNTSAEKFLDKMLKEYKLFWNDKRLALCKSIGFSPVEVTTIASIVEEETQNAAEKPTIAGVYINRLQKGMLLQADPTVKFAWKDFSIKRVWGKYTEIESPYNTYQYKGLPPGPICIPSISSIKAVLNYEKHEYLYFCAKGDGSHTHAFARTLEQHNRNAREYHGKLNQQGIY